MLSPSEMRGVVVAAAMAVASCDSVEPDSQHEAVVPEVDRDGSASMSEAVIFEDAQDFSIFHDTSNLRHPDMTKDDYRRSLQSPAREEFKRTLPDVHLATQLDLGLLSWRWFVQGSGFVVQNHSERSFSIAARFSTSASADSDCQFTVPWKSVGPKASAMFTGRISECTADRAKIFINDEFGFFVGSAFVEPEAEQ